MRVSVHDSIPHKKIVPKTPARAPATSLFHKESWRRIGDRAGAPSSTVCKLTAYLPCVNGKSSINTTYRARLKIYYQAMNDAMHIFRQPAEATPSVEAVIAAVAQRREPAILDSSDTNHPGGRYTIVTCEPVETYTCHPGDPDPFEAMRDRLAKTRSPSIQSHTSFIGGWIGYFAYEAGRFIERLPATTVRDIEMPVARFALYDSAAVYDAYTRRWELIAAEIAGTSATSVSERLARWNDLLHNARQPIDLQPPSSKYHSENMSREDFLDAVRRAQGFISAGDIFQVNLARRLTFATCEPPIHTFVRLRRTNPSPYAAYLAWSEQRNAILSASPELFLQLDDRNVTTRPIKGTRPRSSDPILDAAYRADLLASPKDRAELTMIVDLERNDFGRVCEYGSIRVISGGDEGFDLETHPTVHHLVATVTGRLQPGRDAIDVLRAGFPGGSITGAPKVRAMEIIDQLEPTQRSVYTGAIGYFSLDGSAKFNIAIRTLILADERIHLQVGGGIVADSVPEDEYEETTAKALGLCRALGQGLGEVEMSALEMKGQP